MGIYCTTVQEYFFLDLYSKTSSYYVNWVGTVNHGYKSNGYKSKTLIRAEVLNQNQNWAFMK